MATRVSALVKDTGEVCTSCTNYLLQGVNAHVGKDCLLQSTTYAVVDLGVPFELCVLTCQDMMLRWVSIIR